LFEEIGGNPSQINFQTVIVGTACANAYESKTLELSCHGQSISDIKFASFGNPQGACGSFTKGSCESNNEALSLVKKVRFYLILLITCFFIIILYNSI